MLIVLYMSDLWSWFHTFEKKNNNKPFNKSVINHFHKSLGETCILKYNRCLNCSVAIAGRYIMIQEIHMYENLSTE